MVWFIAMPLAPLWPVAEEVLSGVMNLALNDYSTMLLLYSTPRKDSSPLLLLRWVLHHTHAVVDISHFLHVFRYSEAEVYRFSSLSMPRYAVIDRSSVLPLAAFQSISHCHWKSLTDRPPTTCSPCLHEPCDERCQKEWQLR